MSTFKLYIRYRGHIVHKYESAVNASDAQKQAIKYFHKGSIIKCVELKR